MNKVREDDGTHNAVGKSDLLLCTPSQNGWILERIVRD